MTCLVDTHVLIWSIIEPDKLSTTARKIIESPENRILVSAASFWEISIKSALGKLQLVNLAPEDLPDLCKRMDFESIPLEAAVCASYHKLTKAYHRDPFDRMLIWQAKHLNVPIVSKDASIQLYTSEGISVIW